MLLYPKTLYLAFGSVHLALKLADHLSRDPRRLLQFTPIAEEADPLRLFKRSSQWLSLKPTEQTSLCEIQLAAVTQIERFAGELALDPSERAFLREWRRVVEVLRDDFRTLAGAVEWVGKYHALEAAKRNQDHSDAVLEYHSLFWHEVYPRFGLAEPRRAIQQPTSDPHDPAYPIDKHLAFCEGFLVRPPAVPRAEARSRAIRGAVQRQEDAHTYVGWTLVLESGNQRPTTALVFPSAESGVGIPLDDFAQSKESSATSGEGHSLGEAYYLCALGTYVGDARNRYCRRALSFLDRATGEQRIAEASLALRAMLHEWLNEPEAAEKCRVELRQLQQGSDLPVREELLARYDSVRKAEERLDFEQALNHYRPMLGLAERINDVYLYGKIRRSMAYAQFKRDRTDQAIRSYTDAAERFEKCGARFDEALTLDSLADECYRVPGDYPRAIEHWTKAASLFLQSGNLVRASLVYENIGSALAYSGKSTEALEAFQRAYGYAKSSQSAGLTRARLLIQMARQHSLLEEWPRERDLLEVAIRTLRIQEGFQNRHLPYSHELRRPYEDLRLQAEVQTMHSYYLEAQQAEEKGASKTAMALREEVNERVQSTLKGYQDAGKWAPAVITHLTATFHQTPEDLRAAPPIEKVWGPVFKSEQVLRVAADGSAQYRTIGEALVAAPDFATIEVKQGEYTECLHLRRPVRIVGIGHREMVLIENVEPVITVDTELAELCNLLVCARGQQPAVVLKLGATLLDNCVVTAVRRRAIASETMLALPLLRNCQVNASSRAISAYSSIIQDSQANGAVLSRGTHIVFRSTFSESEREGLHAWLYAWVFALDSKGLRNTHANACCGSAAVRFVGCNWHEGASSGIFITDNSRGWIDSCRSTGNQSSGLLVTRSTVRVVDSHFSGNALYGVDVQEGSRVEADRCKALENKLHGFLVTAARLALRNSTSSDNMDVGVFGRTGAEVTVEGLAATGNGTVGLLADASKLNASKTVLSGNKSQGVCIRDGSTGTLTDCRIHGNSDAGGLFTASKVRLRRCQVYENTTGLLFRDCKDVEVVGTETYKNARQGLYSERGALKLTRVRAYLNGTSGFYLNEGDESHLIGCESYRNTLAGFYFANCAPQVSRCVARDGKDCGFFFLEGATGVIEQSTSYGNTQSELAINGATPVKREFYRRAVPGILDLGSRWKPPEVWYETAAGKRRLEEELARIRQRTSGVRLVMSSTGSLTFRLAYPAGEVAAETSADHPDDTPTVYWGRRLPDDLHQAELHGSWQPGMFVADIVAPVEAMLQQARSRVTAPSQPWYETAAGQVRLQEELARLQQRTRRQVKMKISSNGKLTFRLVYDNYEVAMQCALDHPTGAPTVSWGRRLPEDLHRVDHLSATWRAGTYLSEIAAALETTVPRVIG